MSSSDLRVRTLVGALALASGLAQAAVIRVPKDQPTVQQAIDAARPGDVVLVAPGSYREALTIDKSITLASERGPKSTTLQANDWRILSITLAPGERVAVLGFTMKGAYSAHGGAAVDVHGGTALLEDNAIVGNGGGFGAAAVQVSHGDLVLHHNWVFGNGFGAPGAGVCIVSTRHSELVDNRIEGNHGSGVHIVGNGHVKLLRNILRRNILAGMGGGLRVDGDAAVFAADNLIVQNTAGSGGGVSIATADNLNPESLYVSNTIADNEALGGQGHALFLSGHLTPLGFGNSILQASATGGTAVWCQVADFTTPAFGTNDIWSPFASPAQGTCASDLLTGTNVLVDPELVDSPRGHPYHLAPTSPLIDAGDNATSAGIAHDLGGRPRVIDGGHGLVIDIGAYEYRPR